MKKYIIPAVALALSMNSVFAETPKGDKPQSAEDMITAQVQLTKDSAAKMLRDLNEDGANQHYEHADFQYKVQKFTPKIEPAMTAFESVMRDKIFPEIRLYSDNYASVYKSSSYSQAEKSSLLVQISRQLEASLPRALSVYESEIRKLISITDITAFPTSNYDGGYDTEFGGLHAQEVFETWIYPHIQFNCHSSSCMTLTSVMDGKYIQLIESNFLNDLDIQLIDGTKKTLHLSNLRETTTSPLLQIFAASVLPSENESLPFDITAAEIPAAIRASDAEADIQRKVMIQDMGSSLTPGGNSIFLSGYLRLLAKYPGRDDRGAYFPHQLTRQERKTIKWQIGSDIWWSWGRRMLDEAIAVSQK